MSEQLEQTTTTPQSVVREIPVTRVKVDENSAILLLRAFASKAYSSNVFPLAEAAKLHEVFEFLDNQAAVAKQQATQQLAADVDGVSNTLNAVTLAVEEAVNKKISNEDVSNVETVDSSSQDVVNEAESE